MTRREIHNVQSDDKFGLDFPYLRIIHTENGELFQVKKS